MSLTQRILGFYQPQSSLIRLEEIGVPSKALLKPTPDERVAGRSMVAISLASDRIAIGREVDPTHLSKRLYIFNENEDKNIKTLTDFRDRSFATLRHIAINKATYLAKTGSAGTIIGVVSGYLLGYFFAKTSLSMCAAIAGASGGATGVIAGSAISYAHDLPLSNNIDLILQFNSLFSELEEERLNPLQIASKLVDLEICSRRQNGIGKLIFLEGYESLEMCHHTTIKAALTLYNQHSAQSR